MAVPTVTYSEILTKGLKSALATTEVENGKLRFATDTGELFLDDNNSRTKISDIIDTYTEAQIFQILAPLPKIYLSSDTHKMYVNVSGVWYDISAIDLSEVSSSETTNNVIWFSRSTNNDPKYDSDLYYDPANKKLVMTKAKIGDMEISSTTDLESGEVTVDFN